MGGKSGDPLILFAEGETVGGVGVRSQLSLEAIKDFRPDFSVLPTQEDTWSVSSI